MIINDEYKYKQECIYCLISFDCLICLWFSIHHDDNDDDDNDDDDNDDDNKV